MKKAGIFDLNGVLIVGKLLSEQFRDKKGVPPEVFLPALEETMHIVRKPGAGSVYEHWKKYFDAWGIQMSEREFFDIWFGAEEENVALVELCRELKGGGIR